MLIGYARVSTERQDLAAQLVELERLGVSRERVYTDRRTGKNTQDRPGLREALAATRSGDTLVVSLLDRLWDSYTRAYADRLVARSVTDARDIVQTLYERGAALQIGT